MVALARTIHADSTERTIAETAKRLLAEHGVAHTWYYVCPAFVLLGDRSCLSMSGRDYVPADHPVGLENLVTVDLSPSDGPLWGDYARSLCIGNGNYVEQPVSREFQQGLAVGIELHALMKEFVSTSTTFHQFFEFANEMISSLGYENIDFMGNVGHSIATRREDRVYIERGNLRKLGDVPCFTFEPHIRRPDKRWGFKREDIYYFREGRCVEI